MKTILILLLSVCFIGAQAQKDSVSKSGYAIHCGKIYNGLYHLRPGNSIDNIPIRLLDPVCKKNLSIEMNDGPKGTVRIVGDSVQPIIFRFTEAENLTKPIKTITVTDGFVTWSNAQFNRKHGVRNGNSILVVQKGPANGRFFSNTNPIGHIPLQNFAGDHPESLRESDKNDTLIVPVGKYKILRIGKNFYEINGSLVKRVDGNWMNLNTTLGTTESPAVNAERVVIGHKAIRLGDYIPERDDSIRIGTKDTTANNGQFVSANGQLSLQKIDINDNIIDYSTLIGDGDGSIGTRAIKLGAYSPQNDYSDTTSNVFVIGSNFAPISDLYFGKENFASNINSASGIQLAPGSAGTVSSYITFKKVGSYKLKTLKKKRGLIAIAH